MLIAVFSYFSISAYYIRNHANFKIKKDTRYVVFGHSHPECAFNDSLIDHFENYAQSGESFFYASFKLKKIVEQNPAINTIFIDFSNNLLEKHRDSTIWADKYISNRLPIYLPFMNFSDFKILYSHNFPGFVNSLSLYLKEGSQRILGKDLNYSDDVGGYQYLVRNKTDSLLKYPPASKAQVASGNNISLYSVHYLENILSYCRNKNINVFLIRSPIHPGSPELKNEISFFEILRTKFSGVEFLDFKNFPLLNSEFGDLEHLNYRGAKIFSIWFNNLLHQNLLEQTNKQQFIDQKIKELNAGGKP